MKGKEWNQSQRFRTYIDQECLQKKYFDYSHDKWSDHQKDKDIVTPIAKRVLMYGSMEHWQITKFTITQEFMT